MDSLAEAVVDGASAEELERRDIPREFTAAHLRVEDVDMFAGVADKDVRKSLRVGAVPMPELAPDEVLVAVMASSINYNTVWSAIFEPLPTFDFLRRFASTGGYAARHDQPYHVLGSDAAGVIVRVGAGVRGWRIGDHVVASAVAVEEQEPATHADAMRGARQRAWGYETNFGGLAHYTVLRASQLLPKAPHLTWEEAATSTQCAGTSYRMLVSDRGARMKAGDVVLIWGASGGLGVFAAQLVRNGGGVPVGVVGSPEKAEVARRVGCEVVVDRSQVDLSGPPIDAGKRLGRIIRREVGEDPHIAFDYTGKATFGISVFVVRRGGAVVTCGSSTGYEHSFDNRYLWMNVKRVIGSHGANLAELDESNRLFRLGHLAPVVSALYPLAEIGAATRLVQRNGHVGKVGVLCLAPAPGLGVTDPEKRARIGAGKLDPLAGVWTRNY
ncbi:crotonyl-CoA carboxylase/reductase [Actinomadura flavalba]|uniref:crotonyl-CoA carboxylase/reductase n=1 Tax=Actinomadura flavalba TaxID=1120938 RepID=UPI00039EC508|nr:crotonyl-CoA carboxylase/reductase [Actinomadura flavalba]